MTYDTDIYGPGVPEPERPFLAPRKGPIYNALQGNVVSYNHLGGFIQFLDDLPKDQGEHTDEKKHF